VNHARFGETSPEPGEGGHPQRLPALAYSLAPADRHDFPLSRWSWFSRSDAAGRTGSWILDHAPGLPSASARSHPPEAKT